MGTKAGTRMSGRSSDENADETDDGPDGVELVCQHCGYVWVYTGEMWKATCPRCGKKTPSGLKPDEFKDGSE